MQEIIVTLIALVAMLWSANRMFLYIKKLKEGNSPCAGCGSTDCPVSKSFETKKNGDFCKKNMENACGFKK